MSNFIYTYVHFEVSNNLLLFFFFFVDNTNHAKIIKYSSKRGISKNKKYTLTNKIISEYNIYTHLTKKK
jgi:hypothetical protein